MSARQIWVAGHNGMVGSAVKRLIESRGGSVLVAQRSIDLRNQTLVQQWLQENRPEAIVFAAAKVGGIMANDTYSAEFIYDNLAIQTNVIHAAHLTGVQRLLFLGSSCIYPKFAEQPIREESLLTGPLEPTNQWYAIAKIAGLKMCEAYRRQYGRQYISMMPCNLYGPGDNFNLASSHVLPALIRKFHEAHIANEQEVVVWGTGTPLREFLHVDDLASAVLFCLDRYDEAEHINCGAGSDLSILALAELVKEVVGFKGVIRLDLSKPDGTPRKLMDSSKLNKLGWHPTIELRHGVESTYQWFLQSQHAAQAGRH